VNWMPDRKIWAGGIAGLIAWGLCLLAGRYGLAITPDQQTMLTAGVGAAISYITPPSQYDKIKRLNDQLVQLAIDDPNIPVTSQTGGKNGPNAHAPSG